MLEKNAADFPRFAWHVFLVLHCRFPSRNLAVHFAFTQHNSSTCSRFLLTNLMPRNFFCSIALFETGWPRRYSPLKTKRMCFIQGLSAYRAVNTLHFGYKSQSLNVL
jgi:hypothetical protein